MKRSRYFYSKYGDDSDDYDDLFYKEQFKKKKPRLSNEKKKDGEDDGDVIDIHVKKNEPKIYAKHNNIYFISGVNKNSVDTLIRLINEKNDAFENIKKNRLIKSVEPNPIYLHITSFGGCLFSGFKAADAIRRSKVPIYTVVDGYAASAGSIMSVVGRKRYMTPRSYVLIHQLSSSSWGKFAEMEDEYFNSKMMMKDIVDLYRRHTKMDRRYIEDQLKHDSWWRVDKCLEKGLIDEVLK